MEIKLLKTDIKSNMIPKVLIFTGEEQALAKQYIESISSTLNKYAKYYDSADAVLVETSTNLREDFLYIILNDNNILKNPRYIEGLSKTNRNVIIYFTNKLDETFVKNNKELIVDFKKLDKYTLLAYITKKLSDNKIVIEQEDLLKLIDYCDYDLGICLNELDKIICLGQSNSTNLLEYMYNHDFPDYRKLDTMKVAQKILNRDKSAYTDVTKLNDSVITILTILYNQARYMLTTTNNNYYSNILKLCYTLDSGIKDGTVNSESTLDYLLLEIFQ